MANTPELTIKFSHDYEKLPANWEGENAYLMSIGMPIHLEDQTRAFLEYDTAIMGGGNYPLPAKGKYLLLLFAMEAGTVFTTIRRWTQEKEAYYRKNLGNKFRLKRETK